MNSARAAPPEMRLIAPRSGDDAIILDQKLPAPALVAHDAVVFMKSFRKRNRRRQHAGALRALRMDIERSGDALEKIEQRGWGNIVRRVLIHIGLLDRRIGGFM